jgi:hypothetical protein
LHCGLLLKYVAFFPIESLLITFCYTNVRERCSLGRTCLRISSQSITHEKSPLITLFSARALSLSALYIHVHMYHILSYWVHASGGRTFVSDDVPSSFRLTFQFSEPVFTSTHVLSPQHRVLSFPSHSFTYVIPPFSVLHSSFVHFAILSPPADYISCRIHIKDTGISCAIMSRAKRTPQWPWKPRA